MVKVKLSTGQEVEVRKPTAKQLTDAQLHSSKLFVRLINEKDEVGNPTAIFRSQLVEKMKQFGLWSDEDERRLTTEIDKDIRAKEVEATHTKSKSVAKDLAFQINKLRGEKLRLIYKKSQLDLYTVEAQVDNAKFDYLVSACVYNSDGTRLYPSVEKYIEVSESDDASLVATELSKVIYSTDSGWQDKLAEQKIFKKLGLVDEKGNLLVDDKGNKLDSDGFRLNEAGQRVDDDGNLIEVDLDSVEYTEE